MGYEFKRRRGGSEAQILADLQRVAKFLGKETVSQEDYKGHGEYGVDAATNLTGKWNDTLRKAGLKVTTRRWSKDDCLRAVHAAWNHFSRQPTYDEYKDWATANGHPCVSAIEKIMVTWDQALEAFSKSPLAVGTPPPPSNPEKPRTEAVALPHECGEPTGYDLMPYAPLYENGVLVMFATLAREMGFSIECVRPQFPDCVGRRRHPRTGRYHSVIIEFERDSSNFKAHGHPHGQAQLLVCWEHDWADAPKNLEILSLKNYLRQRGARAHSKQAFGSYA